MDSMENISHHLISAAQSARDVIGGLESRAQSDKTRSEQQPFWYDDVDAFSPDWALVLAGAMDWLDRAPQLIVRAYMGPDEDLLATEFSRLTKDLQALKKDSLKEGSDENVFFYIGPKKESVGSRLDAALARKNELAPKINEQMSRRRQALQMTDDSHQLAAICADALPELLRNLDTQLSAIDIEQSTSMAQAQSLVKKAKQLTRAREAIESVSRRISIALSSESASAQEDLERSIHREEKAHEQLDLLCQEISSAVMRDQISEKVAPKKGVSKEMAPPQKALSVAKDTPSSMTKFRASQSRSATDAFHKLVNGLVFSSNHRIEIATFFSKLLLQPKFSAATPLSEPLGLLINAVLEVLDGSHAPKHESFLSVFTLINRSMQIAGKDCNGDTVIGHFSRPFFLKKGQPIQVKHIDWMRVKSLAIESLKFHPDEALDLLIMASRFAPSGGPLFKAHHLNYLLDDTVPLTGKHLIKAVQTFQALCDRQSFLEQLEGNSDLAWDMGRLSEFFSPGYCSLIVFAKCKALLDDPDLANEHWFNFKDLAHLHLKELQDLSFELIARVPSPGLSEWMNKVLNTSIGVSDLGAPITRETRWINDLNECEKRCRDDGAYESISLSLLHHAICIENHSLVKHLINGCPQVALDETGSLVSGIDTLRALLNLAAMHQDKDTRNEHPVPPSVWCKLFSPWIECPLSLYDQQKGAESISPLMFTLRHGLDDWTKGLLGAGANPYASRITERPIHEIARRVIASLGLEEGVDLRSAPFSMQQAFIENLTLSMDRTGLWDIDGAVPKSRIIAPEGLDEFHARILAHVIVYDIRQEHTAPSQARTQEITKNLTGLSKTQFIDVAACAIMLNDDPDQDLFRVFQYGVDAGILKEKERLDLSGAVGELKQEKRDYHIPRPVMPMSRTIRF